MVDRDELVRRQQALVRFGDFVLDHNDLRVVLQEGCRIIAATLGADLAKVIEVADGSGVGLVVAGVGWRPGIVGQQKVDLSESTSEAFALKSREPMITQDIAHEHRFVFPTFMREHGVVAFVNVPIVLPGRRPYGLLQVDSREPRAFGEEDVAFLQAYAMVLGPVIDRLKTVVELRQLDERLHLIVENARAYAMVLSDDDGLITTWLGGSDDIFGYRSGEVIGKPMAILFTDEDRAQGEPAAELARARADGAAPNLRWHLRKDGSRVFLDGQTVALKDREGAVQGFLKIAQDVTDRKRNEERQALLLAELQHRVRNVLAMVRSLVSRTVRGDRTVEDIKRHLEGRIDAMARTQALLTRALGLGVDLRALVDDELLAQAAPGARVSVSGPRVRLAPKAAEVLTLAVHELATNATKYGALGELEGRLAVSWEEAEERGERWLRFSWIETGVRRDGADPARRGFGAELITRRVPYELNGEGRLEFTPDGVRCLVAFPLVPGSSILETDSPADAEEEGRRP